MLARLGLRRRGEAVTLELAPRDINANPQELPVVTAGVRRFMIGERKGQGAVT